MIDEEEGMFKSGGANPWVLPWTKATHAQREYRVWSWKLHLDTMEPLWDCERREILGGVLTGAVVMCIGQTFICAGVGLAMRVGGWW